MITTILANLGFLIYFKYFNFLIDNCNSLFHSHISALDIVMPIGICLFPQLIAGPIVKYHDVAEQIDDLGVKRFICKSINVFLTTV